MTHHNGQFEKFCHIIGQQTGVNESADGSK
jgi:hypothetical protein